MPDHDHSLLNPKPALASAMQVICRLAAVLYFSVISADLAFPLFGKLHRKLIPQKYSTLRLVSQSLKSSAHQTNYLQTLISDTGEPKEDSTTIVIQLPERDEWGPPYRAVLTLPDHQIVRVYSFGPDRVSKSDGLDTDDITDTQAELVVERYQKMISRCLGTALIAWDLFLLWAIVIRKRRRN